jgi:hypothetical protein
MVLNAILPLKAQFNDAVHMRLPLFIRPSTVTDFTWKGSAAWLTVFP